MKEMCIDVRMAFHSGIGTYIRNIVPALSNIFKLRLICHPNLVDQWPFLRQSNLIPTSCPIYSIQEQAALPFLIPACDIFWTPHYNFPLAPLRAKKKIVTIHDVYHLAGPLNILKKIYARQMMRRAVKRADQVVTVSRFSQGEIIKFTKGSEKKISVIPLGVNSTRFSPSNSDDGVKLKYQLPDRYFLYVGNLASHKNIERLLLAWDLVKEKLPGTKLVLVTKNKIAPPTEGILLLNHVLDEELPTLYAHARALIHPSLYEGFGLTPLEAMSCGCPVVTSKVASLPEVCAGSALYIDPYKIEEIATAMEKLSQDDDLRNDLIKKGLQRSELFSWEKTVEAHIKMIMEKIL